MDINIQKSILLGLFGMAYAIRSLRLYMYTKSKWDLLGILFGVISIVYSFTP